MGGLQQSRELRAALGSREDPYLVVCGHVYSSIYVSRELGAAIGSRHRGRILGVLARSEEEAYP